jgi:hypothetical protein
MNQPKGSPREIRWICACPLTGTGINLLPKKIAGLSVRYAEIKG